ncbi:flagellar basal body rod protein [Fictibacillus terranigra]|uniref:Flagellar basal body rod protein n=1 Tax=Fictibacillus terranigra TaxID=3058424 RepID=A0ABT8E0P6_9BACL|nr:flagellar basal body rod protein [Fictibacillus sp. CENA-BCM004]MDN4071467.1 flagellar basal body rod protein [Fictibacillus sp. CENA-BCM004]
MKKFGLFVLGGIAAVTLLANIGPMIGLAIGLVILYFAVKGFMKAETTSKKMLWGAVGVIAACAAISNVPALLGVLALYVLYLVYKGWNKSETEATDDPFVNFEKQWAEMNRN